MSNTECTCETGKCVCGRKVYTLDVGDLPLEEAKEIVERYHKIFNARRVGSRVITLKEFDDE